MGDAVSEEQRESESLSVCTPLTLLVLKSRLPPKSPQLAMCLADALSSSETIKSPRISIRAFPDAPHATNSTQSSFMPCGHQRLARLANWVCHSLDMDELSEHIRFTRQASMHIPYYPTFC